jgi:negative regulator of replication initiation
MVRVEVDEELYQALLSAAVECGMTVDDFAGKLLEDYLEDNYGKG